MNKEYDNDGLKDAGRETYLLSSYWSTYFLFYRSYVLYLLFVLNIL